MSRTRSHQQIFRTMIRDKGKVFNKVCETPVVHACGSLDNTRRILHDSHDNSRHAGNMRGVRDMAAERNPYGSPGLRLLHLYVLLATKGRPYTLERLSDILNCSKQTTLRLIEQLQRVRDCELESWIDKRQRYYRITAPFKPEAIALNMDAIQQLLMCRDIVSHLLPKPITEEIDDAIGTASGNRSNELKSFAESRGKGFIDYTPFQKQIRTLQTAMNQRRLCALTYHTKPRSLSGPDQQDRTYDVAPLKILAFREALYLRCDTWENGNGNTFVRRTLPIHRIHEVRLLRRTFESREDHDDGFFGFDVHKPIKATIRFSPDAATYVAERIWSQDQKLHPLKNGGVELALTTTSRRELLAWVLSFGPEAELVAPQDLRNELQQSLDSAHNQYTSSPSSKS